MSRTVFIVDGFNLYHSLVDAETAVGKSTKWLDLHQRCSSYLSTFQEYLKDRPQLSAINYFSAPQKHEISDRHFRHSLYMGCLEATGVNVKLGRFMKKYNTCPRCKSVFPTYEEKESDVAMGVKLVDVCLNDKCDVAVIISGDTDLLPAIKMCKRARPNMAVFCIFPYLRKNDVLANQAQASFSIKPDTYKRFQFPNPFVYKNGKSVPKPFHW